MSHPIETKTKAPPGRSTANWRQGYQADVLRNYPLGPGANPLTNNYQKRYGGSNSGGASIGGGM